MAYAETLTLPRDTVDRWVSPDREALKENFDGMELERVRELLATDEGKQQLLTVMKESDPGVSEQVDKILPLVDRNVEQLEKKESFLTSVVKMPVHLFKAVGNTIIKHPVLSAIGAAGIVALLFYFFGPAAGTVGALGQRAIESFGETVLGEVPIPTPDIGMGAVAETPAIGGLLGPEAMEAGQSAGDVLLQNLEAAQSAGISDGAMKAISETAEQVIDNPLLQNLNPVEEFFKAMPAKP